MSSNSQKRNKPPQTAVKNPASSKASPRPPYIDWIHCNVCYEQYMRKRHTFYLLACDHVTCQQCVTEIKEPMVNGPIIFTCSLCRQKTRACKMGNDMPSHLKELFHPEPYLDGLNTHRIMVFQQKHRRRFTDYLDRQYTILQEYKQVSQKDREQAKKCYHDLEELKIERKRLEKRVVAIKNQRKEIEEKRNSTNSLHSSSSSQGKHTIAKPIASVSTSNSSGPRMPRPTGQITGSSGITSFSHHGLNHSFVL